MSDFPYNKPWLIHKLEMLEMYMNQVSPSISWVRKQVYRETMSELGL